MKYLLLVICELSICVGVLASNVQKKLTVKG